MSDLLAQVDALLDKLQGDLDTITQLREQVDRLNQQMTKMQHDYDQILGPIHEEAARLDSERRGLRAKNCGTDGLDSRDIRNRKRDAATHVAHWCRVE